MKQDIVMVTHLSYSTTLSRTLPWLLTYPTKVPLPHEAGYRHEGEAVDDGEAEVGDGHVDDEQVGRGAQRLDAATMAAD